MTNTVKNNLRVDLTDSSNLNRHLSHFMIHFESEGGRPEATKQLLESFDEILNGYEKIGRNINDILPSFTLHVQTEKENLLAFIMTKNCFLLDNNQVTQCAQKLIDRGANMNWVHPRRGKSLLHYAVDMDNEVYFDALVSWGANAKHKDPSGQTVLHIAAQNGVLPLVQRCLNPDLGLDVHEGDLFGSTPLHWAANAGALDVIEYLVTKGGAETDLKVIDKSYNTPRGLAATLGNQQAVDLLDRLELALAEKKELEEITHQILGSADLNNEALQNVDGQILPRTTEKSAPRSL